MKIILLVSLFIFPLYSQPLEKVSLQFHWKDQFEFAGYYMAKEKGFYKDAGLDVAFKSYKNGINITKEVTSGNVTYGIGGSDLLVDIANGSNIFLITSIFQSSPLVLLTTKKSGIKSIKDFKNKKVMLTPDTLNSVTYNAMIKKENISFNDMHVIKHSFDVNDLISGEVDLFQSYITNEPFSLKKAGIEPIVFDPKDYGFDFYSDILFTSKNEIDAHKQRAIRFKEASLKGWSYAFEHIQESVDVILKKYNSQNRTREALLYEALESKKLAYDKKKSLGQISENKIQRMYDAYNIMNLISTPKDIKQYLLSEVNNKTVLLTQKELAFLKQHPTLVVSNEPDYPPYDFFEDGIAKGYSIDLIKLLAEKLDIDLKFETDTWENLVKKFCEGKIDILHPSDKSDKILKCAEFTKPITQDTSQFLLRSAFKKVSTLKDLYGYTIASPKGWQQTEHFKKEYKDKLKFIEVNNTLEAIEKVRTGEADFAFDYGNVLRYLTLKHNYNGLKVEGVYAQNSDLDNLYIAVQKNDKILRNILQKVLDSLTIADKTKLQQKWFGKSLTPSVIASLTDKEKEFIRKHPKIRLGYSFLSQPIVIKTKNSTEGFAVDLASTIKNQTGLNIEFEEGVWKDIVQKAQDRKLDGLAVTVSKNENRKKYFDFTTPYMTQTPVVFVKNTNPLHIKNVASLRGKKMAILTGVEAMEDMADKFGAEKIYFDNIRDVIDSVVSQKSDFSIFFENIFFIANSLGLNYIELAFALSTPLDAFFSVRSDYPELKSIIDKVINRIPTHELINSKNIWFDNSKIFPTISLTNEQINYINNKHKITVCLHSNFSPYEGIISDIFQSFHKKSGIDFKVVKTKNPNENLEYIKNGKCDLLPLATNTKKMQESFDFTTDYINSTYVILTKNDKVFIDNMHLLSDKEIAIDNDYATIDLLKSNYPNLKIKVVQDINEALQLIRKDEVYGYVNVLPFVVHYLQENSLVDVKINGKLQEKANYSIATRKDEPILQNIMQNLLHNLDEDTKQQIYTKWIAIKYEKGIDYSLLWKTIIVATIIALLLTYKLKISRDNKIKLELLIQKEIEKSRKKDNLIFQQNKMASLGNMISTIAHQWRQPLSQLSMSQNMFLRQLETNKLNLDMLKDSIKDDQEIIKFMSNTIETFENFYKENAQKEVFNISKNYRNIKQILQESFNLYNIEIIENIDDSLILSGYPNYLSQVLLSIFQNSLYFLKARHIKEPKIFVSIRNFEEMIAIEIEDNAQGVENKNLDAIFNYGFSQKVNHEKSTGIGLYIARLIIMEKCKGDIQVQNTINGAKFTITLP